MTGDENVEPAGYLTSELLSRAGFRHAFFTRQGGVSEGAFGSLNFSVAAGDDAARVAENLRRAGRALGVDPQRIYFLSQVHGRAVELADAAETREAFVRREGDIVVGELPSLACAVRSCCSMRSTSTVSPGTGR